MKREFLKELGIAEDIIGKIMDENGKDINAEKAKVDAYKSQVDDVQAKLKAFDGVDVAQLQGKVAELTSSLAVKDTEYQQKLADIEFSRTLESVVAGAKPRNVKAVMALLDTDALKASKNQQADIKNALEAVKKENDFLFDPVPRITGPTPGAGTPPPDTKSTAAANDALRSLFGKGE